MRTPHCYAAPRAFPLRAVTIPDRGGPERIYDPGPLVLGYASSRDQPVGSLLVQVPSLHGSGAEQQAGHAIRHRQPGLELKPVPYAIWVVLKED